MTINEYMCSYSVFARNVKILGKTLSSLEYSDDMGFIYGEDNTIIPTARARADYERRRRILHRATKKINTALCAVSEKSLRDYIIWKYFYNMTNSEIAEVFSYSERHIYRIRNKAWAELEKNMKKFMPKLRRTQTGGRFYPSVRNSRRALSGYIVTSAPSGSVRLGTPCPAFMPNM